VDSVDKQAKALCATKKRITTRQRKWIALVASGGYSDSGAYQEAFGCEKATADSSAWRLRSDPRIMLEVLALRSKVSTLYAQLLTKDSKKGRLMEIMLTGKDADSIRAIGELNRMEEVETGADSDKFAEVLMAIARKRRQLPHEDPSDIIDI